MKRTLGHPSSSSSTSKRDPKNQGRPSPKLFIGGLHRSTQEKDILLLFQPYGKLTKVNYFWHLHGPRKGEPRGFCFVEFATIGEATTAMGALDGKVLHGRSLTVRYLQEGEGRDDGGGGGGSGGGDRAMLAKAKARATAAGGGGGGGGGTYNNNQKRRREHRGGGDEEEEEESALDAQIRLLKAKIAAGSSGGGGGRSSNKR